MSHQGAPQPKFSSKGGKSKFFMKGGSMMRGSESKSAKKGDEFMSTKGEESKSGKGGELEWSDVEMFVQNGKVGVQLRLRPTRHWDWRPPS